MTLVLIGSPLNLMSFSIYFYSVNLKLPLLLSKKCCITFQTMFAGDDVSCHFDYKKRLSRELLIVPLIESQTIKD